MDAKLDVIHEDKNDSKDVTFKGDGRKFSFRQAA
jgi:hypothetical protein